MGRRPAAAAASAAASTAAPARAIEGLAPTVAVATSGGRDSTALLHCTLRQAAPLGLRVLALHVHHGLQPQADAWMAQVRSQARRWGAEFAATRLTGAPSPGDSVEAWARRERYAALTAMARQAGCSLVLLAHHRQDQAETVLLQALRGAGAAGLAAMPATASRGGITWARPWLQQPRQAIAAYLRRHRLQGVHDPSNDSPAYSRSRLRQQVWPVLAAAFPQAEAGLLHSAQRLADERALLDEVAAADLAALARPAGPGTGDGRLDNAPTVTLDVAALRALSPPRQRQVLRLWLRQVQPQPVPETLVRRLADELPRCVHAGWPGPRGQVLLRRGRLHWQGDADAPGPRQGGD